MQFVFEIFMLDVYIENRYRCDAYFRLSKQHNQVHDKMCDPCLIPHASKFRYAIIVLRETVLTMPRLYSPNFVFFVFKCWIRL